MNTKRLSISLPAPLYRDLEREVKRQQTSRSEFIRHLFRMYQVMNGPKDALTPAERRAVVAGREEFARGEYVPLDRVLHELGDTTR